MSVRNHCARNYSDVSSFPPANKLIQDAGISSRKMDIGRAISDEKAVLDDNDPDKVKETRNSSYSSVQCNTGKTSHSIKGEKENAILSSNMQKHERVIHINAASYLGNNGLAKKATNKCIVNRSTCNPRTAHEHILKTSDRKSLVNKQQPEPSRELRPKSARPESRRERRLEDTKDDYVAEVSSKPQRPKSARPESRMMRLLDAADEEAEYKEEQDALPPRPKTSHSRRRSDSDVYNKDEWSSPEMERPARPKSRLGYRNRTMMFVNDNHDPQVMGNKDGSMKIQNQGKKSKNKYNVQNDDKTNQPWVRDNETYGISRHDTILQQEESSTFKKEKTMLGLNYGIDDIDLDVDPVQYFMQDDKFPSKSVINKPSLSKETIEFIGNTKSTLQSKPAVGYHGDYQNKHNSFTESTGGYHRNRFLGRQNNSVNNEPLPSNGDNRRRVRLDSDSQLMNKHMTSLSRDDYQLTGEDTISETRLSRLYGYRKYENNVSKPRTTDLYNISSNTITQTSRVATKRKPGKLQPISTLLYNKP